MKISLVAAPFVEVPPLRYGGRERVINDLSLGLRELEVDVTLYCSGDSTVDVPRIPISDTALFNDPSYHHKTDREKRLRRINEYTVSKINPDTDLINCHDYDNPNLINLLSSLGKPIVVSVAHAANSTILDIYNKHRSNPNLHFHGVSRKHVEGIDPNMPFIYNGVDPSQF